MVALGRAAAGSLDFSISADLVDDRRVNVVEVWADAESLTAFRGEGIEGEQQSMLIDVAVREYDASPR